MHEASLHDRNAFITLTYRDETLPEDGSLRYRDFQLFMRRLRKVSPGVRFFMCGEYGDERARPHFHACLFNCEFADRVPWKRGQSPLFRSDTLDGLWPYGFASVGDVTFESAAYVARYVMKKVTGRARNRLDADTGEISDYYGDRVPEFCHMSLKPGIGADWLRLFWPEVLQSGKVVMNGVECNAPKFYIRRLRNMEAFASVEYERYLLSQATAGDRSEARLVVREQVASARLSTLKRSLS